jgi:hypothetical protein
MYPCIIAQIVETKFVIDAFVACSSKSGHCCQIVTKCADFKNAKSMGVGEIKRPY